MRQGYHARMASQRHIGIDYGSKRVGVAVSDETGVFALPVSVIINTPGLVTEIERIASQYETTSVVLGESRAYDGRPNSIHMEASEFKSRLEARGLRVEWEPEFMTSVQAERAQGKMGMTDASAAALILQSYLDRRAADR